MWLDPWCVVINKNELVKAVRALNAAGRPARADTVSIALGAIADDGRHWDLMAVADDLAELESLGKLERAAAFDWEGVDPPPKAHLVRSAPRAIVSGQSAKQPPASPLRFGGRGQAHPHGGSACPTQRVGRPAAARGDSASTRRAGDPNHRSPALLTPEVASGRSLLPREVPAVCADSARG